MVETLQHICLSKILQDDRKSLKEILQSVKWHYLENAIDNLENHKHVTIMEEVDNYTIYHLDHPFRISFCYDFFLTIYKNISHTKTLKCELGYISNGEWTNSVDVFISFMINIDDFNIQVLSSDVKNPNIYLSGLLYFFPDVFDEDQLIVGGYNPLEKLWFSL